MGDHATDGVRPSPCDGGGVRRRASACAFTRGRERRERARCANTGRERRRRSFRCRFGGRSRFRRRPARLSREVPRTSDCGPRPGPPRSRCRRTTLLQRGVENDTHAGGAHDAEPPRRRGWVALLRQREDVRHAGGRERLPARALRASGVSRAERGLPRRGGADGVQAAARADESLTTTRHWLVGGTTTVLIGCTLAPAGYA
jgi:hypothetical protein